MRSSDPFRFTPADQWINRFHKLELHCLSRRSTKPLAVIPWIAFMTTILVSSPVLQRRNIPRALCRFWLWQIWRRTVKAPILLRFSTEQYFLLPAWSKLGSLMVAVGRHEPREELFVSDFLRSGDVVLDVGANVGLYTTIAAHIGGHVYAFEPSTQARHALQQNVAMLGGHLVDIVPAALSDRKGTLQLTIGLDVANHLVESASVGPTESVNVLTLDELVLGDTPRIPGRVVLVKIDAEGFDENVLRGGEASILRDKPVLIIETWGDQTIRNWLEERGFLVYLYSFETAKLLEYPKPWTRQANFIAVHSDALPAVQERLTTANRSGHGLPTPIWNPRTRRAILRPQQPESRAIHTRGPLRTPVGQKTGVNAGLSHNSCSS